MLGSPDHSPRAVGFPIPRSDEIIEFSSLAEFIEKPIKVYSSGMRLRLGFAILVVTEPDILVVDEIIAVGDERFKRQCNNYRPVFVSAERH